MMRSGDDESGNDAVWEMIECREANLTFPSIRCLFASNYQHVS